MARKPMNLNLKKGALHRSLHVAAGKHIPATALQAAARHVYATATLLADAVKPQIAIFSDDFFAGHEQITLLEDTIKAGKEQIGGTDETPVSDELLGAMRDSLIK